MTTKRRSNRLLAELGLELPNVEEDAGNDDLAPFRDEWED
jgi:hypothetical protein